MKLNAFELQIIRLPEVMALTGCSRSTIYLKVKQGTLPPPISLGDRAIGFVKSEIEKTLIGMINGSSRAELQVLIGIIVQERLSLEGVPAYE
jgi:prophage regulatory protein